MRWANGLVAGAVVVGLGMPGLSGTARAEKRGKVAPSAVEPAAPPAHPQGKAASDDDVSRKGPAGFSDKARPGQQTPEEAQREALADKKRDQEIAELKAVIRQLTADRSAEKPDVIFQLAELYNEKSQYLASKEMRAYFAATDDAAARRQKGEKVAEPVLDNRQSNLWRAESLKLYVEILRDYPTFPRNDQVLYTLAFSQYKDPKSRAEAVKHYYQLIKQFPQSIYVPEVWVHLGEHYFANNDLENARKSYTEALKSNDPRVHNFALYKLAWCDFNAQDYEGAIRKFKQVIAASNKAAKETDDQKRDRVVLKNEALKDIISPFVMVDATDEAISYFEAQASKKKAHGLTKLLADKLEEAGKHESAIKVYRLLIGRDPNDVDAPAYQQAVVAAYENLRRRDLVAQEMKVLVDRYGPKSPWAQANASNKEALHNAYEATEAAMRKMVTDYHQEAQRTKEVATYRLARDIYKQYLDNFADSENAFNLRFFYAEILYTLQEWEPAAEQYSLVRDSNPGEYGNKDYKKNAAYDAILCYEKLASIARGDSQQVQLRDDQKVDESKNKGEFAKVTLKLDKRDTSGQAEEEIPKFEAKLADACDKYVPYSDEIAVRYKAAFIYYQHHHDVEAARRFGEIISKWPTDKFSRQAADFTLNILENKKQWVALNKISREFLANKKLISGDKDFAVRVAKVVEGAQYNVDEELYKVQHKPAEAAVAFRDFVREFPKSPYAQQALLYAMIIFQDAHQLDQGIAVGEQLLREYPDSKLVPQATLYLANFYEKTAQFPQSIKTYEAYLKLWEKAHEVRAFGLANRSYAQLVAAAKAKKATAGKKAKKEPGEVEKEKEDAARIAELDEHAPDALYDAAIWHESLGEDEAAISAYLKYVEYWDRKLPGFAKKTDAPDVFANVARVRERQKNHRAAAEVWDEYLARFGRSSSPVKVYLARYQQLLALRALHPPTTLGNRLTEDREVAKLMEELVRGFKALDEKSRGDDRVFNAYGHVRFLMVEPLWREYVAINLKDTRRILPELKAKLKRMAELEKAYTEVIGTGAGEWGIAALTRIGLGYEDFARDLTDSPDPKGLNEDQLQMYRAELENKALPLEDKGAEALEKAVEKSAELRLYSDWVLQAQDHLNKLRPGSFGEPRTVAYRGSEFLATAPALLTLDPGAPMNAAVPAAEPSRSASPSAPTAAPTRGVASNGTPETAGTH